MSGKHPFPYFVGINSLEEIACKEDRVVVMNILGNESKGVTPVSHVFSGGNVVAGVQYGQHDELETAIGPIPVYPRLAEVVQHHAFDTGVIYLPPEAVFYAVTELCHYNKNLKKIVIITEKVSVKDQRLIRAVCQANHVDVFGANCLGVADAWQQVRIGGALGGDRPQETLVKGSVAIHSNSGNFSTTIAEYLKTEGFGTSTIISSGKDVIVQFAVPEFLFAARNDTRTKAAVLYVEPGGYYEKQALDWIQSGDCKWDKPLVVCVTGRWKANLTRACGHAGALSGSGDDALTKEQWFDEYFGVPAFDPEQPHRVSEKGVRVASIQHIPAAMKAVYDKRGWKRDFAPQGNLGLKPWFGNDFDLNLPPQLKMPVKEAIPPYNKEISRINKQLGAVYLRQNMRNASGASRINPVTQIAELHGRAIIDLIDFPFESNMLYALLKNHPKKSEIGLLNISLNYLAAMDDDIIKAVRVAKANRALPNQALMAACAILGDHTQFQTGRKYLSQMIDIFSELGLRNADNEIDWQQHNALLSGYFNGSVMEQNTITRFIAEKIRQHANSSFILSFALHIIAHYKIDQPELFLVSAILLHFAFPSLSLKKITRDTAENLITYLGLQAKLTLLAAMDLEHNTLLNQIRLKKKLSVMETSFSLVAYQAVFNEEPSDTQLQEFSALLALTLTNGQGTISAKGAKESVSARNHITAAYGGFLSNTGLAHGGSGYEAVEYLLNSFAGQTLFDPGVTDEKLDVKAIARKAAEKFYSYKNQAKISGQGKYKRIPCINHPVFKGKRVNIDPREDFIRRHLQAKGIQNVFWDFYHHLVEELYNVGASQNIYCVNIDAVIAVISLKLMWKALNEKRIARKDMQDIGFLIFLLGRMVGVSAEISDHRARGTDMDCRTPLSETRYVV